MMKILEIAACFLSGAVASMGLGGGSILIIYLTLALEMGQLKAQGINLLFFIPCAVMSVLINGRNRLIDFKKAILMLPTGILGAFLGSFLLSKIPKTYSAKLFGAFLLVYGAIAMFQKSDKNQGENDKKRENDEKRYKKKKKD